MDRLRQAPEMLKFSLNPKPMLFAGIDVSKDHFDVFFQEQNQRFENKPEGFEALKTWLLAAGEPVQIVLESTGPYYLKLTWFLYQNGIPVSVINPSEAAAMPKR
jgi:transposase